MRLINILVPVSHLLPNFFTYISLREHKSLALHGESPQSSDEKGPDELRYYASSLSSFLSFGRIKFEFLNHRNAAPDATKTTAGARKFIRRCGANGEDFSWVEIFKHVQAPPPARKICNLFSYSRLCARSIIFTQLRFIIALTLFSARCVNR